MISFGKRGCDVSTTKINSSRRILTRIIIMLSMLMIAVGIQLGGCVKGDVDAQRGENIMLAKTIEKVLQEHSDELMSLDGVVGTAIGDCDGDPCIKVYVAKMTRDLGKRIPSTLEGYPVSVEETGEFKALDKD